MAANLAAAGHRVARLCPPPGQDGPARRARRRADDGLTPACSTARSSSACCRTTPPFARWSSSRKSTSASRVSPAGLKGGAVHLSMATISAATACRLAAEHARYRQGDAAAPVFGNPDAAKGAPAFHRRRRCRRPMSSAVGRCSRTSDKRTFVVGPDPSHANLIKLLGNMMTATTLEMLGEVVAVALKRELDPKPLHRHHDEHDVRRTRAQDLRRQDRRQSYAARLRLAAGAQGRASGARRSRRLRVPRCRRSTSCETASSQELLAATPISTGAPLG